MNTTDKQSRHLRSIVTPARTGAAIGNNHRRQHYSPVPTLLWGLLGIAGFAIAAGMIAASQLR